MNLSLPQTLKVFRCVMNEGGKRDWHIWKKTVSGGFTEKTNPSRPEWWDAETYIAICGKKVDNIDDDYFVEFSTLEEIKRVCPSCWPFEKVSVDNG